MPLEAVPPPDAPHDAYAAFRVPAFRLFAPGYVLAIIASQILNATVQWDVYQRTRSPVMVMYLALCSALPVMLFSLPAGQLADRWSRKRILLGTQVVLVLIPLALAFLAWEEAFVPSWSLVPLFALVGANSLTLTFARPARSSLLANLVPAPVFPNAFAWISSLFETSSWVGPALAGWLLLFGVEWAYLAAAGCMATCGLLTLGLPTLPVGKRPAQEGWRALFAGLAFVYRHKPVLAAMVLDMVAVLFAGATYLFPMFAERLGVGPVGYGWLRAAPALGACGMAVWQAHRVPYERLGQTLLLSVVVFGLATMGFGLSTSFWLSVACLVVLGASDNVSVVIRHSLVQSLTPDAMRGRVSAVNQVFISASNDLGGVESGATAAWFGPVLSVVGGGLGCLLTVAGVVWLWPQIVSLGSLAEVRRLAAEEAEREGAATH